MIQPDYFLRWKKLLEPPTTPSEPQKKQDYYTKWKTMLPEPTKIEPEEPEEVKKEKPDLLENIKWGIGEGIKGILAVPEAVGAAATGIVSFTGGLTAAVGKVIYDTWKTGGKGVSFQDAEDLMNKTMELGAYQPRTEAAQTVTGIAFSPFQGIDYVFRKGIEQVTDDPEAQTALRLAAYAALLKYGGKVKGKAKALVEQMKQKPVKPMAPDVAIDPVVQKVMAVLEPAKMLAGKQKAIYKAEWGKRFAKGEAVGKKIKGEKGFYAEKAQLKGEMQRVQYESIRNKLTQTELDTMFRKAADSPALTYPESIAVREGLVELFGKPGGKVPIESTLELMSRVYPREFIKTILDKRESWIVAKDLMLETTSIPRALMASYDLSFGFRQGIFLLARYPREFFSSFAKQFEAVGSEKAYHAIMEDIVKLKNYPLARKGKLPLTAMDASLRLQEEAFFGARLAEKIPVIGVGVRASNRAYTGMANSLRFKVFDRMVEKARKVGLEPATDNFLLESMTKFIGAGTGRGSLKMLERSAVALNAALFSPRLISSRLQLLNPRFYYKLHPFVRKQALQSLLSFAGMGVTVLTMAKLAGKAFPEAEIEVGGNPLSADFGKIKIGDTRIDIWGGFQPYIRTAAQFIMGKTVSTTTGRVTKVGEGYKPLTRPGIVGRGLEYKLAPVASFAYNLLRGSTVFGEKIDIGTEVGQRVIPMVIQDIIDLAKESPELLPVGLLGIVGIGLQTYVPKTGTTPMGF